MLPVCHLPYFAIISFRLLLAGNPFLSNSRKSLFMLSDRDKPSMALMAANRSRPISKPPTRFARLTRRFPGA
jgi:hypothetical protein